MPRRKSESRPSRLAVFDTEGTTVSDSHGTYAVLYSWDLLYVEEVGAWEGVARDTLSDTCARRSGRDCASMEDEFLGMLEDAEVFGYTWKVGIHNITYDFCYMRRFAHLAEEGGYTVSAVAKSSTQLLTVSFRKGRALLMVLFDTLALTHASLRSLGANLGFPKLTMDYTERLAPDSVLSEGESAYIARDTDVLMCALTESLLRMPAVDLDSVGRSVVTKTGIVRKLDREHPRIGALPLSMRRHGRSWTASTVYDADRQIVAKYQFATMRDYLRTASYGDTRTSEVKGCFAGGVNIANSRMLGRVLEDVVSFDLKSAYPAVMLSYRVPVDPLDVDAADLGSYADLLDRCTPDPVALMTGALPYWRGTVVLEGVSLDPVWDASVGDCSVTETMVMQHYKEDEGLVFDGGHIVSARRLVLTVALPEWCEVSMQLVWESARFEELTLYRSYMPPTFYQVLRVVHHYREKSVSKALSKAVRSGTLERAQVEDAVRDGLITPDEGEMLVQNPTDAWLEAFVQRHKENLNALYGILVTNPMREEYALGESGFIEEMPRTEDERMEAYAGASRDALMWRDAGVVVTLYNRYKLVYACRLIAEAGGTVVYCDTDSVKSVGLPREELDALFAPMHEGVEASISGLVGDAFAKVNAKLRSMRRDPLPVPDDPEFRALGKFDYEETYPRFVTTGHKRYAHWGFSRDDGRERWMFRCSGYGLGALHRFGSELEADGLGDLVPLLVLGYDVRYDSTTGIASIQSTVPDLTVTASFEAQDASGDRARTHVWTGDTCPGYAILDAGKIMNNTENSAMSRQRFEAACTNNPVVRACSRMDVAFRDGRWEFGPRGQVEMDWKGWDEDFSEKVEDVSEV